MFLLLFFISLSLISCTTNPKKQTQFFVSNVEEGRASAPPATGTPTAPPTHRPTPPPTVQPTPPPSSSLDCIACWNFFHCCEGEVLNVILNIGAKTCAGLCAYFESSVERDACTILCDAVGYESFSSLVQSSEGKPVKTCAALDACTGSTCAAAKDCVSTASLSVSPHAGAVGTQFLFSYAGKALKDLGAGEIVANLTRTPSKSPLVVENVIPSARGNASLDVSLYLDTSLNPSSYPPGVYSGNLLMCGGDCNDVGGTGGGIVLASSPVNFT
eukprot:CAMPEP_0170748952 /NCGR_PEP_ID=MMETSP0437-20130122/10138_1 /TAXON_ID=0 /ORGANISM="Sexangularia sp." /LENGTH=271 /DNA_ID=CAMNT_0011087847 /DNA_START=11 /DNA_END=823 /DNA_ORIENTATION=-